MHFAAGGIRDMYPVKAFTTGNSKYRACPLLRKMVRGGNLGVKSGKGFYVYNADRTKTPVDAQ